MSLFSFLRPRRRQPDDLIPTRQREPRVTADGYRVEQAPRVYTTAVVTEAEIAAADRRLRRRAGETAEELAVRRAQDPTVQKILADFSERFSAPYQGSGPQPSPYRTVGSRKAARRARRF
jgi:hypothetical protein